ncbi:hypothetical protein [Nocardia sp. NPDC005366]|uniref:hypothetical protein n=1 Tax=Nocardia sp. NPDC005366 TaxID=3156878 RepID=UPI0033A99788
MSRASVHRSLTTVVTALIVTVMLAGCVTNSPKEQSDRQDKAAEFQIITLHMPRDLWTRTSTGAGHKPIEDPQRLTDDPNGMVTVELSGSQLVEYLQILDFNAHGGFMAKDEAMAATVYDALAPVLDRVQTPGQQGAAGPEVTIDAAAMPAEPK